MRIRRLHVLGALVIALWLATISWLVWRERHSPGTATPAQRATTPD